MDKKKMLHIITRLEPGGTLEFFLNLFSALGEDILNKYDITLALGSEKTDKKRIEEITNKKGIKIYYIKELIRNINPYYDLIAFFKILKCIKKEKFDIVYTHTSKAGFLGRVAAFLSKVPRIIHCSHGHIFYGYFNKFFSACVIFIEKFLAKLTDKIIVFTEHERKDNLKFKIGKKEQFVIIPQGIDLKKFDININVENKKKEFNISNNEKVIGVIARLVPVKGHIYFFHALKLVIEKIKDIKVLIVGDGELMDELKNKVKELGLTKIVLFLGNRNDVPEIMNICDLIVLSSFNEGFGLSLVEALICGKPVIATSVGGIPEVIKDKETGLLVSPRNSFALGEAIISLISNDLLMKEMGEKAKICAKNKFDIQNMVESWFNII